MNTTLKKLQEVLNADPDFLLEEFEYYLDKVDNDRPNAYGTLVVKVLRYALDCETFGNSGGIFIKDDEVPVIFLNFQRYTHEQTKVLLSEFTPLSPNCENLFKVVLRVLLRISDVAKVPLLYPRFKDNLFEKDLFWLFGFKDNATLETDKDCIIMEYIPQGVSI